MTVVIGAISGGHVYLAGDSYMGDAANDIVTLYNKPKVYMVGEKSALGMCGGVRTETVVAKAVRSIFATKKKLTHEFMLTEFSTVLRDKLKDSGILKEIKGVHSLDDSAYILAHVDRLYYLDGDLSLWESQTPYVVVGAASNYAFGALAYAHHVGDLEKNPMKVLEDVLMCASQHSHYVRPPYTYLKI